MGIAGNKLVADLATLSLFSSQISLFLKPQLRPSYTFPILGHGRATIHLDLSNRDTSALFLVAPLRRGDAPA